ncbi:MAG: nucleoside phosphorylase, partial [Candidatus Eremiobacterota bacterium]
MSDSPLLEFDEDRNAVIEPTRLISPKEGVPEACVLCFFGDVVQKLVDERKLKQVAALRTEFCLHPLFELPLQDQRVALLHPGVGAPLAACILEEAIALGCRRFVACGGAGVLEKEVAPGHVLLPYVAVRDEGTSHHYLPPSREVRCDPRVVQTLEQVLTRVQRPYLLCKTWTTDAVYRETPARVQRRRAEGCLSVEMEAAALFAVAKFRGVPLGQLLYAGDDVSGPEWDDRAWMRQLAVRETLVWLAAEACLELRDPGPEELPDGASLRDFFA